VSFNVFNGSIEPGVSIRSDGWYWGNGADNGLQYFAAHPLNPDAKLVISEQNREFESSTGHWTYGFRITNEGPAATAYNVQGGSFNELILQGYFSIVAGQSIQMEYIFDQCTDIGGQLDSAFPRDPDAKLVVSEENIQLGADGCWYYGFRVTNEGPNDTIYQVLSGGKFIQAFNVPGGTIEPGASFRMDGWQWPNGADHGAEYFAAHPSNANARLVTSEQNKQLGADGHWYYGFRITNVGTEATVFTVQGGGFH
jgi:hypothetical protein